MKTVQELLDRNAAINREMQGASDEQYAVLEKEYNANMREINLMNAKAVAEANAPKSAPKSGNEVMRELVKAVKNHQSDGDILLTRSNSQSIISSGIPSSGDKNNMTAAGLPVTIESLINPMEMELIYDKLGIKVATGVRGTLQWPALDTVLECKVNGELAQTSVSELDFNKIVAVPNKVSCVVEVSNEAINDAAFDLVGTITTQINKGIGRTINNRLLYLSTTLPTQPSFVGPLMKTNSAGSAMESRVQSYSFTGSANTSDWTTKEPTYKDLKKMKGKVLKTGAQMAGFCYVMDAASYSFLEAQPRDTGSGRFCIENGKIDGDPVFVTNIAAYAKQIVAGCFAYVSCNQHGEAHLTIDPYTKADKNVVRFIFNADFSLTNLVSSSTSTDQPFVVGA